MPLLLHVLLCVWCAMYNHLLHFSPEFFKKTPCCFFILCKKYLAIFYGIEYIRWQCFQCFIIIVKSGWYKIDFTRIPRRGVCMIAHCSIIIQMYKSATQRRRHENRMPGSKLYYLSSPFRAGAFISCILNVAAITA